MGCKQSSNPVAIPNMPSFTEKWATRNGAMRPGEIDQPPPEFREDLLKPYQDVLDGHLPNMTKSGVAADSKTLDGLLLEYKECEERIRTREKEDPLILFYVKQSRLKSIEETIKRHSEATQTLKKRVTGELEEASKNGSGLMATRTLRSALTQAGESTKLSKAEQEIIAKKNQLEIATTELEMLFQEQALLESDIHELKTVCANLTKDYKRQEDIARQLSVNSPGRGEAELLDELASIETRRIKISEVYERWKEARVQVADSCRQFSSALQKWREMKDDSVDNQYKITEEVRDELITALQLLSNAKFYIQHEMPYCTKEEVSILNKALTYIFVDMRTPDRRLHADSCYAAFHNRAVALFAWIDTTLKAIIQPVVKQTAEDLKGVMEELQELRFQNIKHQFPNVTWQHATPELPPPPIPKERSRSISPGETLSDTMSFELLEQLDLSQLAPLPRTVDIFGKPTDELVESYKSTLRESLAEEEDVKLYLEINPNGVDKKSKDSLTEKDVEKSDTVGLA